MANNGYMTLLDIVQNILAALGDDNVNSIGDTVSSQDVTTVVEETYFSLISSLDLAARKEFIPLTAPVSIEFPTHFYVPNTANNIDWIKYKGRTLQELPIEDFFALPYVSTQTDNNQKITDPLSNSSFFVGTSQEPRYYCVMSAGPTAPNTVIFDSLIKDSPTDTLLSTDILCFGSMSPTFIRDDTFVPDLDVKLFPLLLSEAKATCFVNMKSITNEKEELKSRRHITRAMNKRGLSEPHSGFSRIPNYGRVR